MQRRLSAASNKAAVYELHAQGLSQRKIAKILDISRSWVTQIISEKPKNTKTTGRKKPSSGSNTKELSTPPNLYVQLEKAAGLSAIRVIADKQEAQRKQVLDDLQYIRNWSMEVAEKVRSHQIDLQQLQIELGTLKTLSGILHENNRQRMDLFGLAAKKHNEGFDWSIDYIEAAREGGLDVKDPTPTDRPAEEPEPT